MAKSKPEQPPTPPNLPPVPKPSLKKQYDPEGNKVWYNIEGSKFIPVEYRSQRLKIASQRLEDGNGAGKLNHCCSLRML